MLAISKYPHDWASYPMIKQVYDDIIDNKTLLVDTTWTQYPAEVQDNIERWLNNDHHTVVIMNWWDDFGGYKEYVEKYKNNDRVLVLDYQASWFNICDKKFIKYTWEEVQPQSYEYLFLCYQGKWKHNRDAMYSMLTEWNNEQKQKGIVTLQGKNSLKDNIPQHEGDASIDNNPDVHDQNYYPNDIYSLGDIDTWNKHFLNIVTETLAEPSGLTWITEKTIKPIIGSRPFVLYGDEKIYDLLRSFGLETFEQELNFPKPVVADKSIPYWHWQNRAIRTGLKGLRDTDLNELYQQCLPKLEHNFHAWRKVAKDQYVSMIDKVSEFNSRSHTS